jgi:hypothetical protein
MLQFPSQPATNYTDPNGAQWEFNGTGWVRKKQESSGGGIEGGSANTIYLVSQVIDGGNVNG